jgi:hypothetical protein
MTVEQDRAARKWLGWSRVKLALEAGVSQKTIVDFEIYAGSSIVDFEIYAASSRITIVALTLGVLEAGGTHLRNVEHHGEEDGRDDDRL